MRGFPARNGERRGQWSSTAIDDADDADDAVGSGRYGRNQTIMEPHRSAARSSLIRDSILQNDPQGHALE